MSEMADMVMTVKHLTMLLEEARKENQELRNELQKCHGLLWLKETKKLSDQEIVDLIRQMNDKASCVAIGDFYDIG